MKRKIALFLSAIAAFAVAATLQAGSHEGERAHEHSIHKADEIEWQAGPESLPQGSEYTVLEGNPSEEGIFTLRLRFPEGYRIPPHTHPRVERVTVLEGQFKLGMGREFDEGEMEELAAGSFFTMPPGMEHYAMTEDGCVVQLTGVGPWGIIYVNPEDDPRRVFGEPPRD